MHIQLQDNIIDTTKQFKIQHLKSSKPNNFVVLFVYDPMHSLPGIVDGATKTSQVGSWVRAGAWERSRGFSSLPMLEATTSRDQCISVAASVVHHDVTGGSAVGTAKQISGFHPIRPEVGGIRSV